MRKILVLAAALAASCGDDGGPGPRQWQCGLDAAAPAPDFARELGCAEDFALLSSEPLSASIPGARSVKTVLDRAAPGGVPELYFQNSVKYQIHWEFAFAHLSGMGRPIVPELSVFNQTEYYAPSRRFVLGAVTHYEGPDVWVYEIAPYDNASAELIEAGYEAIRANMWQGENLYFHPTSVAIETEAANLPATVKQISTDELFAGIDYQPLNLGETVGQVRFFSLDDLETGYVGFRDLAVLEAVPNDISVVAGIISAEFQTPLSHVNVLSQNRGTPNMGLRGAFDDPALRALEGKWVHLTVSPFEWTVTEVTLAEAEAWWEEHGPEPLEIAPMDLVTRELRDLIDIVDVEGAGGLLPALRAAIPTYGGKATHTGALGLVGPDCPTIHGFAIPFVHYVEFMDAHGFRQRVEDLRADPAFRSDPAVRDAALAQLREDIRNADVDPAIVAEVQAKIDATDVADGVAVRSRKWRFRSSTNSEDLQNFTGAGLYTSTSYDPLDPDGDEEVVHAMRTVWASLWNFRAYEEREYHGIDHAGVGMSLLVHPGFPSEEANGVALTANIFDSTGLEPGFYVNVQLGEVEVVNPPIGITSDQFIYYFEQPGQPIVYLAHSTFLPPGETVLTTEQVYELGVAMKAIHGFFDDAYGPAATGGDFYAMDIEFKFDEGKLTVKQARPHPGWGL